MPKDTHPPAFQFYVDDFISDGAVDAMTNEELGIYMRLLCKAWKEEPVGTVPNDERVLANWAKATTAAWKKCREAVLRAFVLEADRWHQRRMKLEWAKMQERSEERKRAGSKGGSKTQAQLRANGQANGQAKSSPSSSPSSSSSISTGDGDGDGNLDSSFLENARTRAKRISEFVPSREAADRELIVKIAVLWEEGEFSDEDVEQALASFNAVTQRVHDRPAYFYRCMANRCDQIKKNFEQLLKFTPVPASLMMPPVR